VSGGHASRQWFDADGWVSKPAKDLRYLSTKEKELEKEINMAVD